MNIFVRLLLRKAISSWAEHELSAFTDGQYIEGTAPAASAVHVARLQVRYGAIRSGMPDDVYENVLHFVNSAAGLAGEAVLDTQKAAVETAFNTFWGAVASRVPSYINLQEFRWYGLTLGDPISGPPTRVTAGSHSPGTWSSTVPSQVASSITLRTALRKHWGRIYLPLATVGTDGMVSSSTVDALANSFKNFATSCQAASITPVVFSPVRQSVMSIAAIEVDNVPDIIRRRRAKANTYSKILTS